MPKFDEHLKLIRKQEEEKIENSAQAKEARELACRPIELSRYRNERNLMLYPFCSTAKRKRIKSIYYKSSDGKRWLQVTANYQFGMAKIWDFDILRFSLSKAAEIAKIFNNNYFPPFVEFTCYECLKAIGRDPENGKNIIWVKEALRRLSSTTYIGNIFKEDIEIESGFTLICYEYIAESARGGFDKIKITFNERLLESVRYQNGLLCIDKNVLNEDSGLKKRLLELVKVSKGENIEWTVGLPRLQEMCAHEGELWVFKRELKQFRLPWKVIFTKSARNGENVVFRDIDPVLEIG